MPIGLRTLIWIAHETTGPELASTKPGESVEEFLTNSPHYLNECLLGSAQGAVQT